MELTVLYTRASDKCTDREREREFLWLESFFSRIDLFHLVFRRTFSGELGMKSTRVLDRLLHF